MPEVTRELAAYVHDSPAGVATPRAIEVTRHAVLDLLGVVVAGANEPAGELALRYARSQASSGAAAVIGGGTRLAPSLAALVNGTAGHALDFDDIGVGAGHVSVAIVPAALAVAEMIEADGRAFTDALVLGYEVAHRLTTMYADTRLGPYAAGYHKPSVYSVFGATAACARLLGLNTEATTHAIGIAASQAGGLRVNFGTMTKPLHAGIANRTAIEACLLAKEGFTASADALEGRFGWHDVICRGEGDLGDVLDGLGSSLAIEEGLIFKAYPCCGANHYAIDAAISVLAEHNLSVDDVTNIDVSIESRNLNDVLVYPWARTPMEGKFSLAYNVAAALVDHAVTVDTFTDASLDRLTPYRNLITVHGRDDLPQNGAEVVVRTRDGRVLRQDRYVLLGSVEDPMSWDELSAKFRANVSAWIDHPAADAAIDRIAKLETAHSLTGITQLLLGQARSM